MEKSILLRKIKNSDHKQQFLESNRPQNGIEFYLGRHVRIRIGNMWAAAISRSRIQPCCTTKS